MSTAPRSASRRARRLLTVLVVGLLGFGLTAADEGVAGNCSTGDSGLLREVTAPFPAGDPIADLVAITERPGRLWATDGATVRVTEDGGCTWADAFGLDAQQVTFGARIIDLVSPSGDADWISAFVVEPTGALPGTVVPSVATSRDGGAEWFVSTEGLPDTITMEVPDFCARTCGMVGTTDGDQMITLWFTEPGGVSVYWTISGGRSWTPRSVPSSSPLRLDFRTEPPASEMVIDHPGYLGLFGSRPDGATVSDDGGRTWNSWPEHFGDFGDLTFAFPDEQRGAAPDGRLIDRYLVAGLDEDGGLVATHAKYQDVLGWSVSPATGVTGEVTGLTNLGDASLLLVSTTTGIFLGQQVALDAVTWSPLVDVPGQRHVQAAHGQVWMHDDTDVRVIDPDVLPLLLDVPPAPTPIAELDLPPFDPANPIGPLPGAFRGLDGVVTVPVGREVELPLSLDLPALDPKVDLFFMVARHDSMQDELDSLKDEFFFIIKDLQERDVDVNVGIGVYGSQVRYHRYRDIGPANDEFKAIVDDIYGFGVPLSAYTALDAALVGTVYPQSGDKFATFPGLEVHWRPNATRVMLHVTDQVPSKEDDGPPPQVAQDALTEVGVLHLGLIAGGRGASDWRPFENLARVSGAIANTPLDCNGDGVADLQPGDPIVCEYLAGATSGLATGLPVLGDLSEVVVDALDSATAISPLSFHTTVPDLVTSFAASDGTSQLDLLAANVVPAVAAVRCTQPFLDQLTTVRLSAASGTRGLATTTIDVVCGQLPVPPPPAPAPVVVPAPEPAPVEPAIVTQVAPALAPAPVPVAQAPAPSNIVPNSGFAAAEQREEQFQQAGIGRDQQQPDAETELAFSARRDRNDAPATLAIGAAMTIGAGALARRRQASGVRRRIQVTSSDVRTTSRNSRG